MAIFCALQVVIVACASAMPAIATRPTATVVRRTRDLAGRADCWRILREPGARCCRRCPATTRLKRGALAEQIDKLIAARVDGVYSSGTACQFYSQSEDEFDRIHSLLARKCNAGAMQWQAGASHMSAQTSFDRARRVARLGPSAIQIILPDWFPVTDEEAIRFLSRVTEAVASVPLVMYNPPHAKRSLSPAEFGILSRAVPALIGVKVPHSAAEWCRDFLRHAPGLSLFVPGHALATGTSNGAHGAYSNVACLSPPGAVRWNRRMTADHWVQWNWRAALNGSCRSTVPPFRRDRGIANQGLDKLLARPVARQMLPELFEGEIS